MWLLLLACNGDDEGFGADPEPLAPCPTQVEGPELVRLPMEEEGVRACVDRTEVTAAHYQLFLDDTAGDPGAVSHFRSELCDWNATLEPSTDLGTCTAETFDPAGHPDKPVVCVDWCDAVTFCAWAGKNLCGEVGGGPLDEEERSDERLDAWFLACSAGGANAYVYGDTYEPGRCNDAGSSDDSVVAVGSYPDCRSPDPDWSELEDLNGNAAEWSDSCETDTDTGGPSADDWCLHRGGGAWEQNLNEEMVCGELDDPEAPRGPYTSVARDNAGSASLGFRCCGN